MKIAIVPGAFLPQVGGVELGAYNLTKQLQARGHQVHVITARPLNGDLPPFEYLDGIPVHRLRFYLFRGTWKSLAAMLVFMPLACLRYARLLQRERFDVINVRFFYHNAFATWVILPLLRRWGMRIVVTLEGGDAPNISREYRSSHRAESALLTWAARRLLPSADGVTAVSAELGRKAQQEIPRLTDCVVVHNGVNLDLFMPGPPSAVHEIVSVGRLTHQKGYDVLLCAFVGLRKAHPSWRLTVIGDGPLRTELEALALQLNLTTHLRFLGTCSQPVLAEVLRRASLFVLASRFEGFPLVALEAMACGTPVVMTDVEGARELIAHADRGRVVSLDDADALARALSEMIGLGSDGLQAMGSACRQWVETTHSWKQIARDYERVFVDVLARNVPQRTGEGRSVAAAQLP